MTLKETEQPEVIRGIVTESAINTFTAQEITIPRVKENRLLFDADQITFELDDPVRTTVGQADSAIQLILSAVAPVAPIAYEDPNLIAHYRRTSIYQLLESAAGVFTVQKVTSYDNSIGQKVYDTPRWRNFLYKDNIWLCIFGTGVTIAGNARVKIIGKLEKATAEDFDALLLAKL